MSLAARRSARQREDLVMRLGCLLVSLAVLASLIVEPPKAKAEALTLAVGGGVALLAGYLAACGMTPYVTDMYDGEAVARELQRLGEEFVEETKVILFPGGNNPPSGGDEPLGGDKPSFNDWLGTIAFTVSNGVVRFGKDAADKLNQFAAWVASKYGTKAGMNVVYDGQSITFSDGSTYVLSKAVDNISTSFSLGSVIPCGTEDNPFLIKVSDTLNLKFYVTDLKTVYAIGISSCSWVYQSNYSGDFKLTLLLHPSSGDLVAGLIYYSTSLKDYVISFTGFELLDATDTQALLSGTDLSLDVSETMQQVLDRLTALEEGQSIALDVGATQSMEIQEILQSILDAILAGDLSATAEVVDTAEVPVDPENPEEPDPLPVVPVLPSGLDQLGDALTSRFPFSIPWDVYKGVKLLAAPAKAPYFEVDFMAPIAHRVGGWKGSTKIVLDFAEYEIIGQVSRWASTIGFCLMLASGTKRLIWTA